LTQAEVAFALECGKRAVLRAGAPDMLIFGEMGIGNTTASSAIAAALLGIGAEQVAGHGTGVDAKGRALKVGIIDRAIALHGLSQSSVSAESVLCNVGGLEIVAICGAIIAAA